MARCPRCQGFVYHDDDEWRCLLCCRPVTVAAVVQAKRYRTLAQCVDCGGEVSHEKSTRCKACWQAQLAILRRTRPRVYTSNAARQRAYRERRLKERT